ncbi:MAG: tetratricopeptide repeat protein [Puniceicoccaceae bacterium]
MVRCFRSASPGALLTLVLILLAGCGDPEARLEERLETARALADRGDPDRALEELNQLNEEFPGRGAVPAAMAAVYEETGEDFFAGLFYEQAARSDPDFEELLYPAARNFAAGGDEARAIDIIDEYLERFPDDAEAWRFSGELLAGANRHQSALSAHLRGERLDGPSRNPEYAASVGDLYLRLGNLAQAEIYFATAAEESPRDRLQALIGLLTTQTRSQDLARAEETLALLDEEFPGAVEASAIADARERIKVWRAAQDTIAEEIARLEALAQAEAAAEEEEEEEEEPAEAAGDEPGTGDGETAAAEQAAGGPDTGKWAGQEEAAPADEPADEPAPPPPPPAPPPPPTTAELARAALEEGDAAEATTLFWGAIAEDPDDAELWAGLSRSYLAEDDPENAEIAILEARRREPDSLQYTLTYLKVIQRSRSETRFLEELERAYERIPNSPDIVLSLARAYGRGGRNPANAAYFYDEFLEMAPGHPEVPAARRERNALP